MRMKTNSDFFSFSSGPGEEKGEGARDCLLFRLWVHCGKSVIRDTEINKSISIASPFSNLHLRRYERLFIPIYST